MKDSYIYRFGNDVAISLPGKGETVYLNPLAAKELAVAILAAAKDTAAHKFTDSQFSGVYVESERAGFGGHAYTRDSQQLERFTRKGSTFVRYAGAWRVVRKHAGKHFVVHMGKRIQILGVEN